MLLYNTFNKEKKNNLDNDARSDVDMPEDDDEINKVEEVKIKSLSKSQKI